MLKKAALAIFGLVLAVMLMAPSKAMAQVHIGVTIGSPAPVIVQPVPYVLYNEPYFAVHYWNSGYHEGYYYEPGARYRWDHGHRRYDDRYREARLRYDRDHHDREHHGGEHHDRGHEDH